MTERGMRQHRFSFDVTDDEYRALLKYDLPTFTARSFAELNPSTDLSPNWHIDAIAAKLEACRRGDIRRLIINVPPRSLKSHCASIAFPAYLLGHDPSAQILCASYAQPLADKLARDTRSVMMSHWYKRTFGTRLVGARPSVPISQGRRQAGASSLSRRCKLRIKIGIRCASRLQPVFACQRYWQESPRDLNALSRLWDM